MPREYAPLYDADSENWSIIARDPYDYAGGTYWFVFARMVSNSKEKAERLADALNLSEKPRHKDGF